MGGQGLGELRPDTQERSQRPHTLWVGLEWAAAPWAWGVPVSLPQGLYFFSLSPSRRRTWVPPGGLLGLLGPQGPAREPGPPHSREAGLAWAGHSTAGRTVLVSSLEEELGAVVGGAGPEGPLISPELAMPQQPTANPRWVPEGAG